MIHDAIRNMNLSQLNTLIGNNVGVKFFYRGFVEPRLSWKKQGYEGFIKINELVQLACETINKNVDVLEKNKNLFFKDRIIIRQQNIFHAKEILKNTHFIAIKVNEMWEKRYPLGKQVSTCLSFFNDSNFLELEEIITDQETLLKFEIRVQQKSELKNDKQKAQKLRQQEAAANYQRQYRDFIDIFMGKSFEFLRGAHHGYSDGPDKPHFYSNFHYQNSLPQSVKPSFDPYSVLGLKPESSVKDIKKKYHLLALKLHPDKNGSDPQATKKFQQLQEAYHILSDSKKRDLYDRFGVV